MTDVAWYFISFWYVLARDVCYHRVMFLLLSGRWLYCFPWFDIFDAESLFFLHLDYVTCWFKCIVRWFAAFLYFYCVFFGVWDCGPFSLVSYLWVSHCWPCSTFITSLVGGWRHELKLLELSEHYHTYLVMDNSDFYSWVIHHGRGYALPPFP